MSKIESTFIEFPKPMIEAKFIKRYKRFFSDFETDSGEIITAHCANTGSMKGLLNEGASSLLWFSDDPKRKLKYSWKAVKAGDSYVGIDTQLPNAFIERLICDGNFPEYAGFSMIKREKKMSDKSRVDIYLEKEGKSHFIEVKNVTLAEDGLALFPDAVTERGTKHLNELSAKVKEGSGAAMVYLVQRDDCSSFKAAEKIDPVYASTLEKAKKAGVKVFVVRASVSIKGVKFDRFL